MALIPNITVCLKSNCQELSISETTGVYNASTNVGGYGTPNTTIGSIILATLRVITPDLTQYDLNLFTHGFPNTNEDFSYNLDLSLLNRTSIEDGYWQFIYVVGTGGISFTATKSYYFYCNAQCCVDTMLASITIDALNTNIKNNSKIDSYIRVKTYLASLKNAANCANETQFNKIKSLILKLCRNNSCKTCN